MTVVDLVLPIDLAHTVLHRELGFKDHKKLMSDLSVDLLHLVQFYLTSTSNLPHLVRQNKNKK